jgi:hypothetical protein
VSDDTVAGAVEALADEVPEDETSELVLPVLPLKETVVFPRP